SSFVRPLFVSLFRYYTPSPSERAGVRIFCLSFHYLPVVLRLSAWLAPACAAHTARRATTSHFLLFIFYLLPK
ncbi:MAG: hypothetical protein ACFNVP_03465, partial [Capnocytophaga ochracea]